jgi:hypothetical protein
MDLSTYDIEMQRLMSQWPHSYSEQRRKIFFNALRDVSNHDFREAVTHCLATCRSAPLLGELTEAVHVARTNYIQQKRMDDAARSMFDGIPETNWADREFVDRCMQLVNDKLSNKITSKQFYQGCDLLDQAALLYKNNKKGPNKKPPEKRKDPYKDDDATI